MSRRTSFGNFHLWNMTCQYWGPEKAGENSQQREDELFAAIATKIIEFAGLDDKVGVATCQTSSFFEKCFRSRFGWEPSTLRLPTSPTGDGSGTSMFSYHRAVGFQV